MSPLSRSRQSFAVAAAVWSGGAHRIRSMCVLSLRLRVGRAVRSDAVACRNARLRRRGTAPAAASGLDRVGPALRKTRSGEVSGESPSGKALDFDSSIRRFDPYLPSQLQPPGLKAAVFVLARSGFVSCHGL